MCDYIFKKSIKKGLHCTTKPRFVVLINQNYQTQVLIEGECSIYMEEGTLISSCVNNHIFHSKCINEWSMKSAKCPLCRGQLTNT